MDIGNGRARWLEQSHDPHLSRSVITNRIDLIQALCEAALLEHGLCCAYLFAAFSLKRHPDEGTEGPIHAADGAADANRRIPPALMAKLRNWESVLLLIARQEMEHLGIVCNLLTSVGGMPYLASPSFPIPAKTYGEMGALPLERFSAETIDRFIKFEEPEWINLEDVIRKRKDGQEFKGELETAAEIICAEMQWSAGDLWLNVEEMQTLFPFMAVPGGLITDHTDLALGKTMWGRWQTPHPPKAQQLVPALTRNSRTINTCIEIPAYEGIHLLGVWRFFYETFRSVDEDDALAQAVEVLLNRLEVLTLRKLMATIPIILTAVKPTPTPLRSLKPGYATIGGFYRQIRKGFLRLCFHDAHAIRNLFTGSQTGNPDIGIADRNVHNMNLATVSDLDSALAAIDQVIETGEACSSKYSSSHYLRLCSVRDELRTVSQLGSFDPARSVGLNPVSVVPDGLSDGKDCTLLTHPDAASVAEIFNAVYGITLQMLGRFFATPDDKVVEAIAFAPLMTMAIRPLAEILTELSATTKSGTKAGPTFQVSTRDLPHPNPLAAWTVFGERLQLIAETCAGVQATLRPEHKQAGERLTFIGQNIDFISRRLKQAVDRAKAGLPPLGVET